MTVASEVNRSGPYSGNGVTTVFGFSFKIVDAAHVQVVKASAAGVETILTLNTDYTVAGVGADTGTITAVVAPATGETITILRDVPFMQETDLENQGPYFAQVIEDALDLMVMRDQQLSEEIGRAVKLPASLDDPDGTIRDGLAADILRLADSAGNIDTVATNIVNVDTVAGISTDVTTVAAIADAVSSTASAIILDEKIFTGDGATTDWTLDRSPGADENVLVWIGGAIQTTTDYTAVGTTLTISPAVANGVEIRTLIIAAVSANEVFAARDAASASELASAASAASAATVDLANAAVAADGLDYVYGQKSGAVVKTKYLDDIRRLRSGTATLNIDRVGAEAQSTRWLDAAIYAFGDISTDLNGLSAVNSIVVNDTMKATHGKQISALQVVLATGGGVTSGTRSAFHSRIAVTGAVANEPLNDMVSHLATGYSTASQGGDGTITVDIDDGYAGGLWGQNANVWLASGATNYRGLYGIEVNATAMTGSSTYAKAGLFVAKLPTDAVRAVADDAGIMFGAEAGAITWKKGIQFGVTWGQWPFTTDSTLIGIQNIVWPTPGGAMNADYGVNFTGVTFASAAFASTGFSVDNSGNVTGNTLLTYNVTGANYERLSAKWSANVAYIEMEKAGTGTSRDIALKTATAQWTFKTNGSLVIPNYLWMNGGIGSRIYSPADGNIALLNAAANDFNMLQFGGTTSAFPGLKKSSTTLQAKLADDSGYADFQSKSLIINDGITAPGASVGFAKIYVDTADGDLKIIFGDGTIKTIVVDT